MQKIPKRNINIRIPKHLYDSIVDISYTYGVTITDIVQLLIYHGIRRIKNKINVNLNMEKKNS